MRWAVESRRILLLDAARNDDRAGSVPDIDVAQDLTSALLAAFATSNDESEKVAVASGVHFGVEAFTRGASLHHTMKAVNALCAIVMQAMEDAAADSEAST